MTQKSHNHGWLARKFFRRSSSTYTLKAKTTYKPIARKKSFGGIHLLSDGAPTSIISGKSLEEISRLGGLSILALPPDFAADRLSLPTCLSATASYLLEHGTVSWKGELERTADRQTGCNAPGIFRVSGTATTINELYRYFDHQFSDAGSPSKVEATVGMGHLPSEPDYALPDIASLFKKIIIGLPGGLLGSLELFEALRSIVLTWRPDPKLSAADPVRLRGRLIALAIFSVTSVYRVYLIQAVLGLVAYFGFEADKAQEAERVATEGRPRQDQPGSELMGYQSLGKVLGPLLLGDMTDSIDVSGVAETQNDAMNPRKSAELHQENTKKSKKQKRNSVPNKLEKDANLTAHVDRANLAAEVMHLLLLNWREVVKQLRELNGLSSFLEPCKTTNHNKILPTRTAGKFSMDKSEENSQFMDVLRGRSLPEEFKGPMKMKRTVRITSRSPMARGAIRASGGSESRTCLPGRANEAQPGASQSGSNTIESGIHSASSAMHTGSFTQDNSGLDTEKRTKSDLAMDQMAMGTILTPLGEVSPDQKLASRHVSLAETPYKPPRTRSSSDAPETAVKIVPKPQQRKTSVSLIYQSSTDKPLPLISDAQRAESRADSRNESRAESFLDDPPTALEEAESRNLHERIMSSRRPRRSHASHASVDSYPFATRQESPRTLFPSRSSGHWTPPQIVPAVLPEKEATYPPRQSSLPSEQNSPNRSVDPLSTIDTLMERKVWRDLQTSSPVPPPTSRKLTKALSAADEKLEREKRQSSGSVKILAQKFSEASRATRSDEQARQAARVGDIPKVYAYVHPLTPRKSPLFDPFISSRDTSQDRKPSPERETLIPKPVREVGRCRKADSPRSPPRTSSPPKPSTPPTPREHVGRRPSIFNIVHDQGINLVKSKVRNGEIAYSDVQSTGTTQDIPREVTPTAIQRIRPTRVGSSYQSITQDSGVPPIRPFPHESIRPQSESKRDESSQYAQTLSIGRRAATQSDDLAPEKGYLITSSPSRVNTYKNASDALKKLERHGSINATLYQEVMHLQRLLERKGEEVQAARRSLDAVREARDARDVNPSHFSPRNSWSKGGKSEDIKEANKELDIWKRRAEEAERKLADIGPIAEKVAEQHGVSVDVLLERTKDTPAERKGIDVEVLIDRMGQERKSVAELYVDEGWGGDALTLQEDDYQGTDENESLSMDVDSSR